MKKIIFSLVILSVMLTGCGKETLSCTSKSNNLGRNVQTKIIVTFDKKSASKVVTNINTTYEQEYLAELEANYQNFKESFEAYKKIKGVKTKLNKKENALDVELEFDMSEEEAKENSGFAEYNTKEEYKIFLEESGYTCK